MRNALCFHTISEDTQQWCGNVKMVKYLWREEERPVPHASMSTMPHELGVAKGL